MSSPLSADNSSLGGASPSLDALAQAEARIRLLEQQLADANAAAQTATRQLAALAEQLPIGVLLHDERGQIEFLNEQYCQLLGLPSPAAQWIGRSYNDLLAQMRTRVQDADAFDVRIAALHAADQAQLEAELLLRDGCVLQHDYIPAGAPGQRQHLHCYRDITIRRAAHRQLIERQAFYEAILNFLPGDVAVLGADKRYRYVNKRAVADPVMRAWLVGKTDLEYAAFRGRNQDAAVQRQLLIDEVLSQRKARTWEEAISIPGGGMHYMLRHLQPVYDEQGEVLMLIGYGSDITQRVLTEQELLRAKAAAEEAVQVRENFLANMSHEIRTPLNGILGMTTLLAKTTLSNLQRQHLNTIVNSGKHLLSVLNDVLDMAKIASGKLEMEQIAFDLDNVLRQAAELQAGPAAAKGLAFGVELAELPSGWVLSAPHRLQQVLLNLLGNAVKFTDQGRVMLRTRLLAVTESTLRMEFRVTDTGIGIAPDKQDLIFESFMQAELDTTRRFGGTGLGLTISRNLVRQLGGELYVQSVPGQGSTFFFELALPRTTPAMQLPVAPEPMLTRRLAGVRVLLVEDHAVNREVARQLLDSWYVHVCEAPDGPTALHLFAHQLFDVVLMDVQMPGMSGLDVTAAIRSDADPRRAGTPIIGLTANAFRADHERYLSAGINACISKPFDEMELYYAIEMLAHRRRTTAPTPLYSLAAMGGRPIAALGNLVDVFLADMPARLSALHEATAANDWEAVSRVVRQIGPSLQTLKVRGTEELVQLLGTPPAYLEDFPAHRIGVTQLMQQINRVLADLAQQTYRAPARALPAKDAGAVHDN